jgi:DNA polymerase-1
MRAAFQATRGCVLVSADYSQIEMRVLAHLCADPQMLQLFRAGGDIYTRLAAKIMNKEVDQIIPEERTKAKVICHLPIHLYTY